MTIDEAIAHALEVAEQNEKKAEYCPRMDYYDEIESRTDCLECATDRRQLAEWLMEVKDLREENKFLISEFDRLVKKNEEQLAEYKRLLKLAVEDFSYCSGIYGLCYYNIGCGVCADCNNIPCDDFRWRYADEAKNLLNDEK